MLIKTFFYFKDQQLKILVYLKRHGYWLTKLTFSGKKFLASGILLGKSFITSNRTSLKFSVRKPANNLC